MKAMREDLAAAQKLNTENAAKVEELRALQYRHAQLEEEHQRRLAAEAEAAAAAAQRSRRTGLTALTAADAASATVVPASEIPLELLPRMHPSHSEFHGYHPHYGRGSVRGWYPPPKRVQSLADVGRAALMTSPHNLAGALPSRQTTRRARRQRNSYEYTGMFQPPIDPALHRSVVAVDDSGRAGVFDVTSGKRLVPTAHSHEPGTWRWGAADVQRR